MTVLMAPAAKKKKMRRALFLAAAAAAATWYNVHALTVQGEKGLSTGGQKSVREKSTK